MSAIFVNAIQGTKEWQQLKLGVVSASNVSRALAKRGTETRKKYVNDLVGQIVTGKFDEINAKSLEHGILNEEAAKAAYAFETGHNVDDIGFIYHSGKRMGVSPDGIMPGIKKGCEIKCPITSAVHVDTVANGTIKPEYFYQVQFSLWVTGYESWDFVSFNPFFKKKMLKIITCTPDAETFKRFDTELPGFLDEVDAALKFFDMEFGEQWDKL